MERERRRVWEIPGAEKIVKLGDPRDGRGDGVLFVREVLETV